MGCRPGCAGKLPNSYPKRWYAPWKGSNLAVAQIRVAYALRTVSRNSAQLREFCTVTDYVERQDNSDFCEGLLPVDIATVANADHLYEQLVVVDLVGDPVVTDAYSVHVRFTHQSDASRRPWFAGEKVDNRPDPLLFMAG